MAETGPGSAGRYRLWDGVTRRGNDLVIERPLSVTRLNDAAVEVVDALGIDEFHTPAEVAAATGAAPDAVARLFDRLRRRRFLEWAPERDRSHVPPVSVIVTARNAGDQLGECLDALDALAYPAYEVVLIDDGSTDDTVEVARAHPMARRDRLRILTVGSPTDPIGIGAARNRGVEVASHDVVAFTDADCRPRPDWLRELVPCLAAHDVVGGRIRPYTDEPVAGYEGVKSSHDMGPYAAPVDPDGPVPYVPTANLVARRSVLAAVGFPERSIAEDVDFCWRAIDRGFDVVYTPAGVVEHEYRADLRSFAARRSDYAASEGLLARTYRHGDGVPLPLGPLLVVLVFVALAAAEWGGSLGPFLAAGVAALGVAGGFVAETVGQYRRLPPGIGAGAFLRSRGRELLSTAYTVAGETARYYSFPIALGAALAVLLGRPVLGAAGGLVVVTTVAFPTAVEYLVERPPISPLAYAGFALADVIGYQWGVYRGALTYRTLAHLDPRRRFRLTGWLRRAAGVSTAPAGKRPVP